MDKNIRWKETIEYSLNDYQNTCRKYYFVPTDFMLLVAYQLKNNLAILAACPFFPPGEVLVPVEYIKDFENLLNKQLNIYVYTEEMLDKLVEAKKHREGSQQS